MKVAIMQPYFWPYIGYFQLLNAVDTFVVYDNIEYTKKGWFNRNRYLCNGKDKYFTIAIARDSDYLDVCERRISQSFDKEKLKNQIKMAYSKAPYFSTTFDLFCECLDYENENLFEFIFYSIKKIAIYLDIKTDIVISSSLEIGHEKKGKDKVISICNKLQCKEYINPIGGQELYSKQEFQNNGINLFFLQMDLELVYRQFNNEFIPALSVLDVLMFNSVDEVKRMLNRYVLY